MSTSPNPAGPPLPHPDPLSARDWAGLVLLALGVLLLRAWLGRAAGLELHFDEAQYWTWSRHPDWSYYSKGPWVAWLIALSTGLFGHGEWQVRLPAWLANGAFLVLLFAFARDLWGSSRAGWWAAGLGLVTPLYFGLGQVMTTDIWLFTFWTWGLWAAWRAVIREQPRAWYELGAAVGLGALTKASIALLPGFLGLVLLVTPWGRRALWRREPWQGLGLALLLMTPVIYWNAMNDWVMVRHEQGHVGEVTGFNGNPLEFLAGQWLLLSPLVAPLMVWRLYRPPRDRSRGLVWWVCVLVLAFFVYKSLTDKVQINWSAPAYIGLLVLFAGHIPQFGHRAWRWLQGGLALSAVLLVLLLFPQAFRLPTEPFKDLHGWRQPVRAVAAQVEGQEVQFILTDAYHTAAEVAFYWPERLPVYITGSAGRRFNQYDLWPGIEREAGRDGLYISRRQSLPPQMTEAFADCRPLAPVEGRAHYGRILRTLYPHLCRDYRPIDWPRPQGY